MTATDLIGKEHNAHLDWLLNNWMNGNSPVCFLEGFPGTGKTTIARELLSKAVYAKLTAVMITIPATDKDPTDDLLLSLATEFNSAGRKELAQAITNNRSLVEVLSDIVNDPVLIIIDEFQNSMQGTRAVTSGGFAKVLSTLANRKWLKGRILLLTNRFVERNRWSEPYAIRTLNGMSLEDGVELLEHFAQTGGRIDEITTERRRDVVKWLGGNPRAIQLLVKSLAYEELEDLIGIQPELWEMRDREVSAELVEKLERELLERTLSQFSDIYLRQLYRLSVHRKPFKRQAIEQLFDDKSTYARFKEEMIDRFLMEQHKGWFNLHPIVREIGLQRLAQSVTDLQQAHSIVVPYYTRHFEAKQIVGWGALGGHFVEARFHLVKADKPSDLRDIASRFQSYIFSTLSESSPVPNSAEELDERIAVLSALLEEPGPKSLEYHLARLFKVRNQRNDLRRGLHHVNRAKSNSSYAPAWLLCSEILIHMERHDEAIAVLKQGMNYIPADKALVTLYERCAQLLAQMQNHSEAIAVLKQGIALIPPDKGIFTLYYSYGELLAQKGQHREAINVLKQGINRIPPDQGVVTIYALCSDLLFQANRKNDAMMLLEEGLSRIPSDKGASLIYHYYVKLSLNLNQLDKAIEILLDSAKKISTTDLLVDLLLLTYVTLRDQRKISEYIKAGVQSQQSALAQTLLYQMQERWQEAAEYAEQSRKKGILYSTLIVVEAFSWLCVNQLNRALEAICLIKKDLHSAHWLRAFIQLRLGNLMEAKQALMTYANTIQSLDKIDEVILLSLWNEPTTSLKHHDIAHYFPTLPPILTGLTQSITKIPYQGSVLPNHLTISQVSPIDFTQEQESFMENKNAKKTEHRSENYVDFDLHIASDGHVIASSPEGEAVSHISTIVPHNIRLSLQLIERRQTDAGLLKEIGRSLSGSRALIP